jgi:Tfp pilus assembly protein FimV
MPAVRVRDQRTAWNEARALLKADRDEAMAGHGAAVAARDMRAAAYQPMAPDLVVWIVAGSIDAAIALGIAVLSVVMRHKPKAKADKPKQRKKTRPAQVQATAPRGVPNWKPRVVS